MVKRNVMGTGLWGALTLALSLALGTVHTVKAEDLRGPLVRGTDRPSDLARSSSLLRVAQARGGAGQRREATQRGAMMERREPKRSAEMKRDVPARERAEMTRAGNGTRRSR